jgi:hypothetical protein
MKQPEAPPRRPPSFLKEWAAPILFAAIEFLVLIAFHANYGYFRDELYYIACSDHMAFGYVDQPPLSIAILWVVRALFGESLYALRFLPALVGAAVVVLGALMARSLGGTRFAQGLTAFTIVAAHGLIGHGRTFSMNPFDVFFWTLALYLVVTILQEGKSERWIPFGAVVGLGLLNKYSIGFMVIGLVAGLLLTSHRKHLATRQFWAGAGIASLLFLPHVFWELQNGFPSLEFMHNATVQKNVHLSALEFFLGQIRDVNMLNAPIWIGGMVFFLRRAELRPLGWMYPVIFLLMTIGGAKVYYLAPIYPLLLAGGSISFDQLLRQPLLRWLKPAYAVLVGLVALAALPFAVPILPIEQFISYENSTGNRPHAEERSSVTDLPQYYADQFGWTEMVDSIAVAVHQLSPDEQAHCVIYVRNYGEAAAVDFFGKHIGLPPARCGHNNYWLWGPGNETGDVTVIIGAEGTIQDNLADLRQYWNSVEYVTETHANHAMPFEQGRMIFICKGMRTTFQEIWAGERFYI